MSYMDDIMVKFEDLAVSENVRRRIVEALELRLAAGRTGATKKRRKIIAQSNRVFDELHEEVSGEAGDFLFDLDRVTAVPRSNRNW